MFVTFGVRCFPQRVSTLAKIEWESEIFFGFQRIFTVIFVSATVYEAHFCLYVQRFTCWDVDSKLGFFMIDHDFLRDKSFVVIGKVRNSVNQSVFTNA